jgi:hypothetical protein
MKRARRRFTVNENTFGLRVEFYVNTPQALALKRCAAYMGMDASDPENAADDSAAAWCMSHGSWALIWIEDHDSDHGSLVHELFHVVSYFLRHIESTDEETGAYLAAYLYKKARAKLDKK